MVEYYKVRVSIDSIDAELAKAYREAEKAVSIAGKALNDAYQKTPKFAALQDLAAPTNYGSKSPLYGAFEGGNLVFNIPVNGKAEGNTPQLYLGEKTINTLLNGKLLTDDEKRQLVESITQGVIPARPNGDV